MTQVKLGFALALCAGALSVFGVAALQPKPVDPSDPFAPGDVGGANAYRYAEAGAHEVRIFNAAEPVPGIVSMDVAIANEKGK